MTELWTKIDIHLKIRKYYLVMKSSVYKFDDTNLQFFFLPLRILYIKMKHIRLSNILQFVC